MAPCSTTDLFVSARKGALAPSSVASQRRRSKPVGFESSVIDRGRLSHGCFVFVDEAAQ